MTDTTARYTRSAVIERGWKPGTRLENRVAFLLGRFGLGPDVMSQQHRVGPYRLDFAAVTARVALEADGWQHRAPEVGAKDARRDAWLRARGWLVFRVDDADEDTLEDQVARLARLIRTEIERPWPGLTRTPYA